MKKLCTTILMVAFLAVAGIAYGDGLEFEAKLSGAQEVSEVITDTTGKFKIEFSDDLSEADFRLKVRDGFGVTQAHIHCAPAGVNGPVVAFLFNVAPAPGPGGVDVDGTLAEGTLTNADIIPQDPPALECGVTINNIASLLAAIRQDRAYVNVHTEANPSGEIRGQLLELFGLDDDGNDDDDDD